MSMDVASMENRKVGLCPREVEIENLPKHPPPPYRNSVFFDAVEMGMLLPRQGGAPRDV